MPLLTYSVSDFVAFTKIRSADVNSRFSDIQTLLNTTQLDDVNIQDAGITRADKLKAGTADTIVTNDPTTGKMGETNVVAGSVLSKASGGALTETGAGTQGQLLRSNGGDTPSWADNPNPTPSHYVKSGAVNADGFQDFIRADGGGADDFTILATATDLVLVISDTEYTLTADINVTGLDAPAISNNTALLNVPLAADEETTKYIGEQGGQDFVYDTGGTSFLPSSGEGKLHAFKINDGSSDEYFVGRFSLDATSTAGTIKDCKRGYLLDSAGAAIPRLKIADGDTITIQKLFWVFVSDVGAATATDIEPIYAHDEPANTNGQMWFDTDANTWNRSNGSSFSVVTETLVGQVIVDENDAVVGARGCHFFANSASLHTLSVVDVSATKVIANVGAKVNILGTVLDFGKSQPIWDIADSDILVGTEAASTLYALYLTKSGQIKMEATQPYWEPTLCGFFHPFKPWRMVARTYNDSSQDLNDASSTIQVGQTYLLEDGNGRGSSGTYVRQFSTIVETAEEILELTQSGTNGDHFAALVPMLLQTINRDRDTAAGQMGCGTTKNQTSLSTPLTNFDNIIAMHYHVNFASSDPIIASTGDFLVNIGDVLRHSVSGSPDNTTEDVMFKLVNTGDPWGRF